jgi:hypothetical protein
VTNKEDSSPWFWLKIILTIVLILVILAVFGPLAAVLAFFGMAVLDKLDKIAQQRSDNDE